MSNSKTDLSKVMIMTVPLSGNGSGIPIEFEAAISVNGSYESAGHRATLFNRLVDENAAMLKIRQEISPELNNNVLLEVR